MQRHRFIPKSVHRVAVVLWCAYLGRVSRISVTCQCGKMRASAIQLHLVTWTKWHPVKKEHQPPRAVKRYFATNDRAMYTW